MIRRELTNGGGGWGQKRSEVFSYRVDAAKVLNLVEESLDQVALFVDVPVACRTDGLRSGAGGRDYGPITGCCNAGAKAVGIIAPVGQLACRTTTR